MEATPPSQRAGSRSSRVTSYNIHKYPRTTTHFALIVSFVDSNPSIDASVQKGDVHPAVFIPSNGTCSRLLSSHLAGSQTPTGNTPFLHDYHAIAASPTARPSARARPGSVRKGSSSRRLALLRHASHVTSRWPSPCASSLHLCCVSPSDSFLSPRQRPKMLVTTSCYIPVFTHVSLF